MSTGKLLSQHAALGHIDTTLVTANTRKADRTEQGEDFVRSEEKSGAIRPYYDRITIKVFEALTKANCEVVPEWTTPVGATDEEVVKNLSSVIPDVLLAPFHIIQTDGEQAVSGLSALGCLQDRYA